MTPEPTPTASTGDASTCGEDPSPAPAGVPANSLKMQQDKPEVESKPSTQSVVLILEFFRTVRWVSAFACVVLIVYFGIAVPTREAAADGDLTVVYGALLELRTILPVTGMLAFVAMWWRERRLRITTVARENRRNRELERKIDSGRTSSGFVEDGHQEE